jgi:type II secretory pathway component PulF
MALTGKSQETGLKAVPDKRRRFRRVSVLHRKARTKDLLLLTELLRQVAACRAPMVPGLARMAADCPNNQASMHLNRLAQHMQAGESLSGAMRQSPKFFPRYYVDLVEVAESSDQLATTLSGLMHEIQSRQQAGHVVRNRIAYIAILLGFIVFVSSLTASEVFPLAEENTVALGGQLQGLPGFGKSVMGYTDFLSVAVNAAGKKPAQILNKAFTGDDWASLNSGAYFPPAIYLLLVGGGVLAVAFLGIAFLLFRPVKFLFERLPGVRHILLCAQWGHALRVLSLLLARGITLDRALDSAAGSDVQHKVRSTLRRLGERVRSGQSLSEALEKERWRAPRSLRSAVAFGEQAGCLADSLSKIAHAYALRAERARRMLSNILFPLAIMGCGVLVLAVHARFFGLLCNSMDSILYQI